MTFSEFFEQNDLAAYQNLFEAEGFDVDLLAGLDDETLRSSFGMTDAECDRFQQAADRLRSATQLNGPTGVPTWVGTAVVPGSLAGPTRVWPPEAAPPGSLAGLTRVWPPEAAPPGSLPGQTRVGAPDAAAPPETPETTPEWIRNYRVLGLIGRGGMAMVVRARHFEEEWAAKQGGDVAIKLINPMLANRPEFRRRFLAEARLGERLRHPRLVSTLDIVEAPDQIAIVMSLVAGEPLQTRKRDGGLPLDEVVELLSGVAEAIDYLHRNSIVHRDIKPENILIGVDGSPVLIDLGIAKDALDRTAHTQTTTPLGTTDWMAPEQADGKIVDGAADRYSFGLVAYVLLAGRFPWGGADTEARVSHEKLSGRLVPLQRFRPDLPKKITGAVGRMLELSPTKRYPSCTAFIEALGGEEEPVVTEIAVPPTPVTYYPRSASMGKGALVVGGVIGVAGLCSVFGLFGPALGGSGLAVPAPPVVHVTNQEDKVKSEHFPATVPLSGTCLGLKAGTYQLQLGGHNLDLKHDGCGDAPGTTDAVGIRAGAWGTARLNRQGSVVALELHIDQTDLDGRKFVGTIDGTGAHGDGWSLTAVE